MFHGQSYCTYAYKRRYPQTRERVYVLFAERVITLQHTAVYIHKVSC